MVLGGVHLSVNLGYWNLFLLFLSHAQQSEHTAARPLAATPGTLCPRNIQDSTGFTNFVLSVIQL